MTTTAKNLLSWGKKPLDKSPNLCYNHYIK
jgi:hypothetical protein